MNSHECLSPPPSSILTLASHPCNSFKNSACVPDFPPHLHNPAQPFVYRHTESEYLVVVCFTKLRSPDTRFPASCFSHLTLFQLYGESKLSLDFTEPTSAPPDPWVARDKGQDCWQVCTCQSHACTHAHTHAHSGALPSPSHPSRTGSPAKQNGDHKDSQVTGWLGVILQVQPGSLGKLGRKRGQPCSHIPCAPHLPLQCSVLPNTHTFSPLQGWGASQKLQPQANNWKADRFAGENGVLYTRCTNWKETIMQRIQAALIHLSKHSTATHSFAPFASPIPALRPRPGSSDAPGRPRSGSFSTTCPQGGVETMFPKMSCISAQSTTRNHGETFPSSIFNCCRL